MLCRVDLTTKQILKQVIAGSLIGTPVVVCILYLLGAGLPFILALLAYCLPIYVATMVLIFSLLEGTGHKRDHKK